MKYYVIADPHGFYTLTRDALASAGFFADSAPSRLVVCGDLLDRGPEARELTEFLLSLHREGRLIYIRGNHEDLFSGCLQGVARGHSHELACGMSFHHDNGTWDTLLALTGIPEKEAVAMGPSFAALVRETDYYQKLLPLAVNGYETPNYVFVHGWIPVAETEMGLPAYDPNWREADPVAWRLARWRNGMEAACEYKITEPGKTVVCGHFHASYGHAVVEGRGAQHGETAVYTPFAAPGILALDACTACSGFVNCAVLEDGEGVCL